MLPDSLMESTAITPVDSDAKQEKPQPAQDQLFEAYQSVIIGILLPVISDYVSQKTGQEVTVEELRENCLEAPSELNLNIVVQSNKAATIKKDARNLHTGCQRILGERVHDVSKRGQPCGETVWKNASGQKALFCSKCMRLKTFEKQVAPLVASWSMTLSQATAGKSNALKNPPSQQAGMPTSFTPVMPPGWQNSPSQNHVYQQGPTQYPPMLPPQTQVSHPPEQASLPVQGQLVTAKRRALTPPQ